MPTVVVSVASSGDNVIVSGIAERHVYITTLVLVFDAAVTVIFQSDATALSGPLPMLANGSMVLDPLSDRQARWLETALGEDFRINLSVAVGCRGWLRYEVAP